MKKVYLLGIISLMFVALVGTPKSSDATPKTHFTQCIVNHEVSTVDFSSNLCIAPVVATASANILTNAAEAAADKDGQVIRLTRRHEQGSKYIACNKCQTNSNGRLHKSYTPRCWRNKTC
jgi:hypothetical protein